MSNRITAAVLIVFLVFGLPCCVAWQLGHPERGWVFFLRWVMPVLGVAALSVTLWKLNRLSLREPLAPDFLARLTEQFFERDGFCFILVMRKREDGACIVEMPFQNRFSGPCEARVELRLTGLFGSKHAETVFEVSCGPGAYGVARMPMGVPAKYQGRKQYLEVAATCRYPRDKGAMLRFAPGLAVGAASLSATVGNAAMGLLGVHAVPATAEVQVPAGVLEELPFNPTPEVKIYWQVGDPDPTPQRAQPVPPPPF